MTAPQGERLPAPRVADERAMLEGWLEYHRATLLMKCAGLDDDQLRLRSAEPSALSLLGLVRHMTDVERGWFRRGVGGQQGPEVQPIYYSDARPEGDFEDLDDPDPGRCSPPTPRRWSAAGPPPRASRSTGSSASSPSAGSTCT